MLNRTLPTSPVRRMLMLIVVDGVYMKLVIQFLCLSGGMLIGLCNAGGKGEEVELSYLPCENNICVSMKYVNNNKYPICIKNAYFPYDGRLNSDLFSILNAKNSERMEYKDIQPSFIVNSKLAKLVRLVSPQSTMEATVDLTKYYGLNTGKPHLIRYEAVAYRCDDFEKVEAGMLLEGEIKLQ